MMASVAQTLLKVLAAFAAAYTLAAIIYTLTALVRSWHANRVHRRTAESDALRASAERFAAQTVRRMRAAHDAARAELAAETRAHDEGQGLGTWDPCTSLGLCTDADYSAAERDESDVQDMPWERAIPGRMHGRGPEPYNPHQDDDVVSGPDLIRPLPPHSVEVSEPGAHEPVLAVYPHAPDWHDGPHGGGWSDLDAMASSPLRIVGHDHS